MKKIIFWIVSFVVFESTAGSVYFFKSLDEYSDKKGEYIGELEKFTFSDPDILLKVKDKANKSKKFKTDELIEVWAFEVDGILFRAIEEDFWEIVYVGKQISLYKPAELRFSVYDDSFLGANQSPNLGGKAYFSLISNTYVKELALDAKNKIDDSIKTQFPELAKAFNCIESIKEEIGGQKYLQEVQKCFIEFDKSAKK